MKTKLYEMMSYYKRLDDRLRTNAKDTAYFSTMDVMKKVFEANHAEISKLLEDMEAAKSTKHSKNKFVGTAQA